MIGRPVTRFELVESVANLGAVLLVGSVFDKSTSFLGRDEPDIAAERPTARFNDGNRGTETTEQETGYRRRRKWPDLPGNSIGNRAQRNDAPEEGRRERLGGTRERRRSAGAASRAGQRRVGREPRRRAARRL